jgi:drug/metabolite transporter (DMT)-like permease
MHAFNASTFSCNKVLLASVSPLLLAGISALGGSILLMIAALRRRSLAHLFNRKTITLFLPIAVCITFLAGALRFYALSHLTSFHMTFFSALDPFLTALLAYILRSQRLTMQQILGIVLAVVGSLPMMISKASSGALSSSMLPLPILAALGAIIVNRYGWIRMYEAVTDTDYSVSESIACITLLGGILSLGASLLIESAAISLSGLFSFSLLGMLVYVIVVSTLVCSRTYASLLREYSVTFLSLTEFLTPLFVALYGWLFLHERITGYFFVSTGLVVAGLFLFSYPALQKNT